MTVINLRIFTENSKTHTKIPINERDTLAFTNESEETLRVTIDKADALLDDKKNPVDLFKVECGESKHFTINANNYPPGSTFKYTATIAGSETEDPIIIIERR